MVRAMPLKKLAASHAHKILAKLIDLGLIPSSDHCVGTARSEEHGVQVIVTIAPYQGPLRIHPDTLERIVNPPPFIPNAVQKAILKALEGKALRSTALARIVGDSGRLFRKPGGMQELRDRGLVAWHQRLGFYRPDAPPKELMPRSD